MPLPKQLDILQRLTAHLEGITPENGYSHTLTGAVFRGRRVYGEGDPIPLLSLLEFRSPDDVLASAGSLGQVRSENWVILVQGFVEDDTRNPTDPAYRLKADVEKRLSDLVAEKPNGKPAFPDAYLLGKRVAGITIGPGVVSPPVDNVSTKTFFYLPVVLEYVTDILRPFVD